MVVSSRCLRFQRCGSADAAWSHEEMKRKSSAPVLAAQRALPQKPRLDLSEPCPSIPAHSFPDLQMGQSDRGGITRYRCVVEQRIPVEFKSICICFAALK